MARTKNLLHKRPQSAPKFNHGLESSQIEVQNIKGYEKKKERRIGRTLTNWTGNETYPGYTKRKNSLRTSFDFRQSDSNYLKSRENRVKSAPITSAKEDDDDDVFTDFPSGNDKTVRKLDIDLTVLETVANANDQKKSYNLMVKSAWNMSESDFRRRPSEMESNSVKSGSNGKYNKASYISTSPERDEIRGKSLQRPKSILSNNRAKSARPGLNNKKVCIVDRPKSCYSEKSIEMALRRFDANFRMKPKVQDYLPKRSFFSCHDNLLMDAGINPRDLSDLETSKRKLKVSEDEQNSPDVEDEPNVEQVIDKVTETIPVPDTKLDVQEEYIQTAAKDETKIRSISTVNLDEFSENDQELSLSQSVSSLYIAARVTGVIARMKKSRNKSSSGGPAPRRRHLSSQCEEYDSKTIKADSKPIVDYLKLVKEKPEQYLAMKNMQEGKTGVGAIDNLVSAGKIFSKGRSQSLVVQAAYELGSKTQPKMVQRYEAEKAKLGKKKVSSVSKPQSRPQSSTHRQSTTQNPKSKLQQGINALSALNALAGATTEETEVVPNGNTTSNGWAEVRAQMTDVERKKAEVEHWLKKLTTSQVVKAREMALRELGEENASIRRWWLSHKYCRYLRKRTTDDHS